MQFRVIVVTDPQTNHRQDRLQYTVLQLARSVIKSNSAFLGQSDRAGIRNDQTSLLEMGKNPKFWVCVRLWFFDDKDSVLSRL